MRQFNNDYTMTTAGSTPLDSLILHVWTNIQNDRLNMN